MNLDTIKTWCSDKENIKILVMSGMAMILLVVLKMRFSEKTVPDPAAAEVGIETARASLAQSAQQRYTGTMGKEGPARVKKGGGHGPKPPPFLKRDLFASRNTGLNPKREAGPVKEVTLELTATIIDGRGALAIIGNEVLGMGAIIQGFRVTSIEENEVILSKGTEQYVLRINEK